MSKNYKYFLVALLVLAWVFDFLFWESAIGVNLIIFVQAVLLIGGYLLLKANIPLNRQSVWVLLPIAFFSIATLIRQEPLTLFLSYLFVFLFLAILANTWVGGKWVFYGWGDYPKKIFTLVGSMALRSGKFIRAAQKASKDNGEDNQKIPIKPILRGVVIALPILFLFGFLLASADLVFAQKIENFFSAFSADQIRESIWRIILSIFVAYLVGGAILHAAYASDDSNADANHGEKKILGFIETSIVLGSVGFLFLSFVVVQFQYFFGGETNIGVQGYTYSQYARRGFNELIGVAFFSLVLILSFSSFAQKETVKQKYYFSGLSLFIVAQVLIILASAYQRIVLGIQWHGYSRLRLYPQIFLVWLGLLLIAVIVLEFYEHQKFFVFAILVASTGFATSLVVFNVDAATAKHNMLRVAEGRHFNPMHLASLSTDAVPVLVEEYLNTELPEDVHEELGATLFCYINRVREIEDWRSFNLSRWRANEALDELGNSLDGYNINRRWRVRTPSGEYFFCYGEY